MAVKSIKVDFFSNNLSDMDLIRHQGKEDDHAFFEVIYDDKTFYYSIPHKGMISFEEWSGLNISSVFIPAGEMLSHSKGFLALNSKYKLPFDYAGEDRIKKRIIDSFEVLDLEG